MKIFNYQSNKPKTKSKLLAEVTCWCCTKRTGKQPTLASKSMTMIESTLVNSHVLCMKCRLACSLSLSGNCKPNQDFSAAKSKSTDKIQFKKDQIKNLIDLTERMEWTLKKISTIFTSSIVLESSAIQNPRIFNLNGQQG